jgi:hypothetical protein
MIRELPWGDFRLRVLDTASADSADFAAVISLFESNYRQANSAYIEKSLANLGYLALAFQDEKPVAFALGESRVMDLPGLPRQVVDLAGICCVDPAFRRRGLFGRLESLVLAAAELPRPERWLVCGRVAHPASFRGLSRSPHVVPRANVTPTPWQQEVGQAIAAAYGVVSFDASTFVCCGSGTPVGYPAIDIEATAEEWEIFKPVNRDRGDSLLAITWSPNAPPGW